MTAEEYNYGTNNGITLQNGRPFSRFGGYGIIALGPKIEGKIKELLSYEWLAYKNALSSLVNDPRDGRFHTELAEILTELTLDLNTPGFPNPDPEFVEQLEAIIDNENEISSQPQTLDIGEYFKHPPSKAAITIQKTVRTLGPRRKLDRIKTRKQVSEVMLKGQKDANTRIVGAKRVRDNVSSFLTGRARGGTKKKRRKRRKKSKKKRQKKRTKRKGR